MTTITFKADNFSRTDIGFKPADLHLPILESVIKTHFPGWSVVEAEQLDRNEINSANYNVVLESPAGESKRVLVREYRVLKDEQQILFYLEFLAKLGARGVRVSRIYETTDGKLAAHIGELMYSVFEFLDATHFVPTEAGFASVAREVAKMHSVFSALDGEYRDRIEKLSKQGDTFFNAVPAVLESDLMAIEDVLDHKSEQNETDQLISSLLPEYVQTAIDIAEMQRKMVVYPKQIFHSDLHPHNILMQRGIGEVAALVDFDSLRVQRLGEALDIAYALYRNGRQFLVGSEMSLEEATRRAGELYNLFIAEYTAVRPLSADEIRFLKLLCKEEMMKKLVYLLKGVYLGEKNAWLHELPKFVTALQEIDCFWG